MHNPNFYIIGKNGEKILRNFEKENDEKNFSIERYYGREDGLDDFNYMYFEHYQMYNIFDSIGSDYERYGCILEEGDVVVDIGANIGLFSRRAIEKGASKVISFEPISSTFSCLVDNVGQNVECHKLAIGKNISFSNFITPDNLSNLGGGSREDFIPDREIANSQKCLCIGLEDLWEIGGLPSKIDFLKIDCEGGESEIIPSLSDERLISIRKISMEYHDYILGPELREEFVQRARDLGFQSFVLFHGKNLSQIHLWK